MARYREVNVVPCRGCAETASYVWERVPSGGTRPPSTKVSQPVLQ